MTRLKRTYPWCMQTRNSNIFVNIAQPYCHSNILWFNMVQQQHYVFTTDHHCSPIPTPIPVFNLPQHKRRERLSPEHPGTAWPLPHQQKVCFPPMSKNINKNKCVATFLDYILNWKVYIGLCTTILLVVRMLVCIFAKQKDYSVWNTDLMLGDALSQISKWWPQKY